MNGDMRSGFWIGMMVTVTAFFVLAITSGMAYDAGKRDCRASMATTSKD
jgi:hypothetical protein